MATVRANLVTAREQMAANLVTVTADPKPNYSKDGVSYSWIEYVKMLQEGITQLQGMIDAEDGPFEIILQGET